eukprot:6212297-Pleurochrysis_carterae.AAC.1
MGTPSSFQPLSRLEFKEGRTPEFCNCTTLSASPKYLTQFVPSFSRYRKIAGGSTAILYPAVPDIVNKYNNEPPEVDDCAVARARSRTCQGRCTPVCSCSPTVNDTMVPTVPPLAWNYKGKEMNVDDPEDNLQIAKIGERVLHDVFDICTILPAGIKDGKLHVKLDEDGSERQLTVGQFRTVVETDVTPARNCGPSNVGGANAAANGTDTSNMGNVLPQPGEGSTGTGDAAGNVEPAGDNATGSSGRFNVECSDASAEVGGGYGQGGTNGSAAGTQPQPDNDGGTNDDGAQNTQLLQAVLAKMEAQVDEFGLFEEGADLVFHKRLVRLLHASRIHWVVRHFHVLIDTKGIASKDGSNIQVGKALRDRGCGQFFVVLRVYKPLLGV